MRNGRVGHQQEDRPTFKHGVAMDCWDWEFFESAMKDGGFIVSDQGPLRGPVMEFSIRIGFNGRSGVDKRSSASRAIHVLSNRRGLPCSATSRHSRVSSVGRSDVGSALQSAIRLPKAKTLLDPPLKSFAQPLWWAVTYVVSRMACLRQLSLSQTLIRIGECLHHWRAGEIRNYVITRQACAS
jgi:hypothetical protein